jgi:general secretion pathway protein K
VSAALSAIAFAVANNVRGETERVSTEVDSLRCYYLAAGSIDRVLLYIQWGGKYYTAPTPLFRFEYPSGEVQVEFIPESAKLNINRATPEDLVNVIQAAGATHEQALVIAQGIVDWRTPAEGGQPTQFDQYYLTLKSSFQARHASFEEIEELLLVRGMTPELFHGRYARDNQGRLVPVPGLKDCLSVYGTMGGFDANTVSPTLMAGLGISPAAIAGIVQTRRRLPFKTGPDLAQFADGSPGFGRLGLGMSRVYTLRATARLRLAGGAFADVQRSVSAMVRFLPMENNPPYHIMRWYDSAAPTQ